MIPPKGFKAEQYPLQHKLAYAVGLSPVTTIKNTAYLILIRHYGSTNLPSTIKVNPHANGFVGTEPGSICRVMAIIDKLSIKLDFNFTKTVVGGAIKFWWQPVFFSFPEKLDATDEKTGTTVASLLGLLKDATEEDVTPLFANTKFDIVGASDRTQPVSTINATETFGLLNMDTSLAMEGVTHIDETLQTAMRYYTNKGALKACLGRRRYVSLSDNNKNKSFFIRKFVPRSVRRIQPYSFFAILIHVPLTGVGDDQNYFSTGLAADVAFIGVKAKIKYHEWHPSHDQEIDDA